MREEVVGQVAQSEALERVTQAAVHAESAFECSGRAVAVDVDAERTVAAWTIAGAARLRQLDGEARVQQRGALECSHFSRHATRIRADSYSCGQLRRA